MTKVIVRIKGGLGNQLFCYAAARRLALRNGAELVLDHMTGFSRDLQYRRKYALYHFNTSGRLATASERMEPLERPRRALAKWLARKQPFVDRTYIEQEGVEFDERLLHLRVIDTVYLDGLWQSEGYFKDIEEVIRRDLRIVPPKDDDNQRACEQILSKNSVAVHVRWFDDPTSNSTYNVSEQYYRRAVRFVETQMEEPHYFVFSDDPPAARRMLVLPQDRVTFIHHNRGDEGAFADLWLMSLCKRFITANSTFSWWAAWLGEHRDKIVVTPDLKIDGKAAWGFSGLIPVQWVRV